MCASDCICWKKAKESDPMGLDLWEVMSNPMCVLGTKSEAQENQQVLITGELSHLDGNSYVSREIHPDKYLSWQIIRSCVYMSATTVLS